jgi:hypothetical protein
LAEKEFFPMLARYLDDCMGVEAKKFMVIMALLGLLEQTTKEDRGFANQIKAILKKHSEIAEMSIPELGPIPGVIIHKILGREIPADTPYWVIDRADEKLGGQ